MIVVACITGNVFRRYPVYWWSPAEVGQWWTRNNLEKDQESEISMEEEDVATQLGVREADIIRTPGIKTITITATSVILPDGLEFDEIDADWLEGMRSKLLKLNN